MSDQKDDKYRRQLMERITRIRNEVAISRMDVMDAQRTLEMNEKRLKLAHAALENWDYDLTQTLVRKTERMSLEPEHLETTSKRKRKGSAGLS